MVIVPVESRLLGFLFNFYALLIYIIYKLA